MDLFGSSMDFSLPDLSGDTTLDGVAGFGDASSGTTDNGSGGGISGFISSAWNAISSIVPSGGPGQSSGSGGATASPLTTAITSLTTAYNSVVSLFGGKPTKNLTNANTTEAPDTPANKTSPLLWIGLGLGVVALFLLLGKKKKR